MGLACRGGTIGYDVMLLVGILRYGLNWQLEEVRPVLHRSLGLPRLSLSTLSYLGLQFLVRWQLFCEERLLQLAPRLRPYLLQIDCTQEDGGPATAVARDARTQVILLARQKVSENEKALTQFTSEVDRRYGLPAQICRDMGVALKAACTVAWPTVRQRVDPYHFLANGGKITLKESHEGLKHGLTGDEGLAKLLEWARKLPSRPRCSEEVVAVVARLMAEWIDEARRHAGSFPFHLAYAEVMERMEQTIAWLEEALHAQARTLGLDLSALGELKRRLEHLRGREAVRRHWARLPILRWGWHEAREALHVARDRRRRATSPVVMENDAEAAKRRIAEAGAKVRAAGEYEAGVWAKFEESLREQETYLWGPSEAWMETEGGGSTVELERVHHRGRSGIRARTHQKSTGEEMGRVGAQLDMVQNLTNRWFVVNGLTGVNLWEVFAGQSWEEIREKLDGLGEEGARERVPIGRKRARAALEAVMEILTQREEELRERLEAWAGEQGLLEAAVGP